MTCIAFTNPKGGTGKTTSAFLLAEQLAAAGHSVALLDLDPNQSVVRWSRTRAAAGRGPSPFAVLPRPPVDEIVDLIDRCAEAYAFVLADLEGTKDQAVTYALARADLCVIPMDGTPLEAQLGSDAVECVRITSNMLRRNLPHAALFTRVNGAFVQQGETEVRAALARAGVPFLGARLVKRSAYANVFKMGQTLAELHAEAVAKAEGKSPSAASRVVDPTANALENARAYAGAILNQLSAKGAAA